MGIKYLQTVFLTKNRSPGSKRNHYNFIIKRQTPNIRYSTTPRGLEINIFDWLLDSCGDVQMQAAHPSIRGTAQPGGV